MTERVHVRISAPLTVLAQATGEPSPQSYNIKNIGLGGAFLLDTPPWPVGSEVSLEIARGPLRIRGRGRVCRKGRDGVGIAFVSTDPVFLGSLEQILADLIATGAEFDERRGEPRYRTDLMVTWTHAGAEHRSRVRDLSFKGAFIAAGEAPAVGTTCLIYLPRLESDQAPHELLGCEARVMHRTSDGFGVRFDHPSPEFRAAIARLVRWLSGGTSGA